MERTRIDMEDVGYRLTNISATLNVLIDALDVESADVKELGDAGMDLICSRIKTTYPPSLYLIRDCIYDLAEELREAQ